VLTSFRIRPCHTSLVADSPPRRSRFDPGSGHVILVVNKTALGQVFSEYFSFPCHSFHRLPHTHHHPSSGAGTIGQTVADVPNGLSLILPKKTIFRAQRITVNKIWQESLMNVTYQPVLPCEHSRFTHGQRMQKSRTERFSRINRV
jgi:hypothetical protein